MDCFTEFAAMLCRLLATKGMGFSLPLVLCQVPATKLMGFSLPLVLCQVPATKEVLSSLPNVFSALCLNARGLEAFVACRPFDRLFKVLLSPDYLPAMRRRRSSDPPGKIRLRARKAIPKKAASQNVLESTNKKNLPSRQIL